MARKVGKPGAGQESLLFDFDPTLPKNYSEQRARDAADRRKRRTDVLALGERTKGFMQRVDDLWIPFSAGENTFVVKQFGAKLRSDRWLARERVRAKYEDSDVSERKVKRWSAYAAERIEPELMAKVFNLQL